MKYDAFISYRHAPMDIEVSEMIHKQLENLRVPKAIRKSSGKRKIERVFRDQEELTVSSSLSDEILSALDSSEYLIVICSPRTPESEWVENEVSYFIKVHGRERILPVIIEGEPKDSFPKPLLYEDRREIDVNGESHVYEVLAEPFAADYRAPDTASRRKKIRKDIFRLAAPILGCRYDDLKQRHRDRQNRRIATAVTAFSILAVLFGVYNYFQNQKILENFRKQQITQSMYLADTSLRLLEEGDRTNAILVALEALPQDLSHPDRPVVPQAEYALSRALNAYAIGSDLVPDYTIEHRDVVTENVKCSEAGTFFAVLDSRGVLNLFDIKTGKSISDLTAATDESPTDRIYDYILLKNERVIAFSSNKMICINGLDGSFVWEVEYNSLSASYTAYSFLVAPCYAISGNESVIAIELSGSEDAYLLNANDGRLMTSVPVANLERSISMMALSRDGSQLAVVYSNLFSEDSVAVAQVFDIKTKTVVSSIDLPYSGVFFASYAPYDKLVIGSYDSSNWDEAYGLIDIQFSCHDADPKSVLWTSEVSVKRSMFDLFINKVCFIESADAGDHILLVVENRVFVFDLATGDKVSEMIAPSYITGSVMNPDAGLFIYTTDMGHVKWGNMYTGSEYKEYDMFIKTDISSMVGSAGYMMVIPYDAKSIMVYSYVEAPDLEISYEFSSSEYTDIQQVSPNGQYLLIGRNSGEATEVYVFDTDSGALLVQKRLPGFADCAVFDEDGIFYAMNDDSIQYYDLEKDTLEVVKSDEDAFIAFYSNTAQTHLVLVDYARLRVMSVETRSIIFDTALINEQFVAVSDDASFVILSGEEGLFAMETGDGSKIVFDERIDLMQGFKIQLAFSSTGDYVAIPGADQYIHIVDMSSGKTLSRISGVNSDVFSGCFIDNDATLVFQSNDFRIRAASVDTGRLVYTGADVMREITHWIYNSDHKIIAAVSDAKALFLNVDKEIYPMAEVPYFAAFSQDAEYVFIADRYMFGRIPYRELDDLYRLADEVLGDKTLSEENRIKYYIDS